MCGINAYIKYGSKYSSQVDDEILRNMNTHLRHRGPDDEGLFVARNIGLGQTRLAILDLSARGHQPMTYEHAGKKVTISFNGEIYNYQTIKDALETKGYSFTSNTDTEVILAAYIEYGTAAFEKLIGMFAFFLFDEEIRKLFCVKDRFGQKPLYYATHDDTFIASSELPPIVNQLKSNGVSLTPDYAAIKRYLTLLYIASPETGYNQIKSLPPRHYIEFDVDSGNHDLHEYYRMPSFEPNTQFSEEEWIKELDSRLYKAVERRLIADVPVGAFLSGGIDSSTIVAYMSKMSSNVRTFSIGFEDKKYDEREYAKQVSRVFGTKHTEFLFTVEDLINQLDVAVTAYAQPFADPSALPILLLSELTRRHVTVALSGDAGDEVFGGYDKYRYHLVYDKFKPLFRLAHLASSISAPLPKTIEQASYLTKYSIAQRHYNFTYYFSEHDLSNLLRPEYLAVNPGNLFDSTLQTNPHHPLNTLYALDLMYYVPDDINTKIDRASMQHALEVRSPFLDHELIEFASHIPVRYKTSMRSGKMILKKLMADQLPHDLLYRKKSGFSVPISQWLRKELSASMRESILDPSGIVYKMCRPKSLEQLIDDHVTGKKQHAKKLWALYMLSLWHQKFL